MSDEEDINVVWLDFTGTVAVNIAGAPPGQVEAHVERRLREEVDQMSVRLMRPSLH